MRMVRAILALLIIVGAVSTSRSDSASDPAAIKKQARTHFRAGTVFYEAGNYDRAVDEYLAAYKLLPLPDLLFNLAQAYRLKGEPRVAIDYYRRYLVERPNDAPAVEARQTLRSLEEQVAQSPPPPIVSPSPAIEAPIPSVVVVPPPAPPPRKRRWIWGVVGASIAVVVGVGVGLGVGLGMQPRNPTETLGSAGAVQP